MHACMQFDVYLISVSYTHLDVYKRQVIHLAPEMAVEKIRFMLSAQVDNGGGLPLVKFTHNPGHEDLSLIHIFLPYVIISDLRSSA